MASLDRSAADACPSIAGAESSEARAVETPIDFLLGLGEDKAAYTPKEKAFLRKLDAFFDAHGLRPISKRMAHTYVKMMANDQEGNFDRVQVWKPNAMH